MVDDGFEGAGVLGCWSMGMEIEMGMEMEMEIPIHNDFFPIQRRL